MAILLGVPPTTAEGAQTMTADRSPARRRTRPANTTNDTDSGGGEALSWGERRWRENVDASIRELTQQQQDTALILKGISTELKEMREQPKEARAWFSTANQGIGTILSIIAITVSLLLTILQHVQWK